MNKNGKPVMTRSYHIPLAMFDDAFVNFQKKHVFPANILLTIVLLAIAGVYIHVAFQDNSNTLVYLLIVACFGIILVRWYKTFKLRRAVHDALKEVESDTYTLSVFEDGLIIHTEEAPQDEASAAAPEETQEAEESPAEPEASGGNGLVRPGSGSFDGYCRKRSSSVNVASCPLCIALAGGCRNAFFAGGGRTV